MTDGFLVVVDEDEAVVGFRVVFDDERPCAADKEETHDIAPVVGVRALLECGDGSQGGVRVLQGELGLTDFVKEHFGANTDVVLFIEEEAELRAEIEVGFVVEDGGEEDDLAVVASRMAW